MEQSEGHEKAVVEVSRFDKLVASASFDGNVGIWSNE